MDKYEALANTTKCIQDSSVEEFMENYPHDNFNSSDNNTLTLSEFIDDNPSNLEDSKLYDEIFNQPTIDFGPEFEYHYP